MGLVSAYYLSHDLTRPLSPWPDRTGKGCQPTTTPYGAELRAARLALGLSLRDLAIVIPLSKGGVHTVANVVPACRTCNARKSAGPAPTAVQTVLL